MKVRFIGQENYLGMKKGSIYNVFAIALGKAFTAIDNQKREKWEKFYIKASGPKYIYPIDISDCEIVDNSLSKFWSFGVDFTGTFYISPRELYEIDYFWEDYYNDKQEYLDIVEKYYQMGEEELFNL